MNPNDITTLEEHQLYLEELFDKNQLFPRVRQAFRNAVRTNFVRLIAEAGMDEEFGINFLAQLAVQKRIKVPAMFGIMFRHFENYTETAKELDRALKHELAMFDDEREEFIVKYEISQKLQDELDKFQYPLPMVVQPKLLESNLDSGYLLAKSSVILRDNHTDDDVCLDHLNRVNSIPFHLNLEVARMVKNSWRDLDKQKTDETWEDFRKRKRAFEKYDSVSKEIIDLLDREAGPIYLTHKYDKRGRTYCMGYHVSYQGGDWHKAVIELAYPEYLMD